MFAAVLDEDKDPSAVVDERGMKQVCDTGAIEAVVDGVTAADSPTRLRSYKEGNTKPAGLLRVASA